MAAELVNAATSEKLKEINWTKSIEICELVACDQGQARDVIKALKRRLETKNPNAQLFSVMLLEMLMNNCGEYVHSQVIEVGLLPVLVKIVKKKSDLPVRKKIFLLLDATQASLGGASGKFPQYHAAYHELVSAGVQFPQRPSAPPSDIPVPKGDTNSPGEKSISMKSEKVSKQSVSQNVPESSILQKASSAMEVLREVLDAMNPQHPEGAKDEFMLDLVEQCSFEKQRVMHLVLTSRDDKLVSQAIEVNEQLQKVLAKHDALLSVRAATSVASFDNEEAEEEEEEQLFRRIQKGKACAKDMSESSPSSLRPVPGKMLHQPLIRPVHLDPVESNAPSLPTSTSPSSLGPVPGKMLQQPLIRPVSLDPVESNAPSLPTSTSPSSLRPVPGNMLHQTRIRPVHLDPVESNAPSLPTSIPPPPAKHRERERFFKEKQLEATATALPSQMGSLTLDRRNGSSSCSGSTYPSK